mmetsp:Transcript_67200/g.187534  ORF Transcript_67200/g.187534 Transcript_67200/m.187534 type:complete len:165 (+) Transcript_67200:87-581(+)
MGAVECRANDGDAHEVGDFTDVIAGVTVPQDFGTNCVGTISEGAISGEGKSVKSVASDAERRALDEDRHLVITLDRSGSASLGIAVKKHRPDGKLYVHALGERGLVPTWNAANPSTEVSIGDRIVEVNGASGDPKLLIDEMHKVQVLSIRLEKAEMDVGNGVAS